MTIEERVAHCSQETVRFILRRVVEMAEIDDGLMRDRVLGLLRMFALIDEAAEPLDSATVVPSPTEG